MKRFLTCAISSVVCAICLFAAPVANAYSASISAQPAYAKWGRLAMIETKKKYPHAAIVDYLHVGRVQKAPGVSQETFKLWLRQGKREWGVYVRILFETSTQRVISISFEETTR